MRRGELGRGGVFRLTPDDKLVAVLITTIDRTRVELMVITFNLDYARLPRGMLIIEDVARWCFERGLDMDLRPLHMD
jgi:CelD/BcsL family acetyltransferase involved in cellulose biosynthesis